MFELKSAQLCYENLKKRAISEIKVAMFAPQAILSDIQERLQLKEEILKLVKEDIKLPEKCVEKYKLGPLNNHFLQHYLIKAMKFLLHFCGRHYLPFQLINKIGLLSNCSDLKNDIALYNAAFEVEAKYSKLRVAIKMNENQYLFERLRKLGRKLSGGKQFYTHEMYTSEREASKLYIVTVFLVPLVEDEDQKKAFWDKKFIDDFEITEAVQVSRENKETVLYRKANTQCQTMNYS